MNNLGYIYTPVLAIARYKQFKENGTKRNIEGALMAYTLNMEVEQ